MYYPGFHLQDNPHGWNIAIDGKPIRAIKIFQYEMAILARRICPGIVVIGRHRHEDTGRWLEMAGTSPELADQAADEFIMMFRDSCNTNKLDYFESLNEEYPTNDPVKLLKIIEFDRAYIRRLPVHCPHTKPVVFCAAIGNPGHNEYVHLLPLAKECEAAGGAFGYHAYWSVYHDVQAKTYTSFVESAAHWRDLHGRWDVIDQYFVDHGIWVQWFLGEGGAIGALPNGYGPKPLDGWKHKSCWNGHEDDYIQDAIRFDAMCAKTMAAREGRLIAWVFFTSKINPDQWEYFQVDGNLMSRFANLVVQAPDPEPIEDDIEEPTGTVGQVMLIDVSEHQGVIDWVQTNPVISGAWIRASIGSGGADEKFVANWAGCEKPKGPYHLFKPERDPEGQFSQLMIVLDGRTPTLPPFINVEWNKLQYSKEEYSKLLEELKYLMLMEFGMVLIYTRATFWDIYTVEGTCANCDLIIAHYGVVSPICPREWQFTNDDGGYDNDWTFWQYTNTGEIPGITGNVDIDVYNPALELTFDEFVQKFQAAYALLHTKPDPEPEPKLSVIIDNAIDITADRVEIKVAER
jgi:lysozyme